MQFRKLVAVTSLLAIIMCAATVGALAAGEYDNSFNSSAYSVGDATVYAVKKQPDGKILVGGYYSGANTTATPGLIRLNADGTVDQSFSYQNLFTALGTGAVVYSIAVQADGKIIVGALFFTATGSPQPGVRRLNTDGSLDNTFTPLIITNSYGQVVHDIEIQSDGKILIAGVFVGSPTLPGDIVRLNTDGSIDSSFASQTGLTIRDIELQSDGSVVLVGYLTDSPGIGVIKRLTTAGLVDPGFTAPNVSNKILAVKIRANGQILIGGAFHIANGFVVGGIAQLNADGSLDLTFNQNNSGMGGFSPEIDDIEFDADGKIFIGGRFSSFGGIARRCIARLNSNGTLDTSFAQNTRYSTDDSTTIVDLEILPTGKVIAGTQLSTFGITLTLFNTDGSFDPNFNPILSNAGLVRRIAYLPDGKVVIGGDFTFVNGIRRSHLARLNSDGSVDQSFVPYFNTAVSARPITALAVQPDGKILIGMESTDQTFRLNTDGSLDTGFTTQFYGAPSDIAVLPNGQILTSSGSLRRLNSNGTLDATFTSAAGAIKKIYVYGDGKILVAGTFTSVGPTLRGRIARLNSDGTLDNTFNPPGGANGTIEDLDVQADGKIVVGGDFTSLNGTNRLRVGRFIADGTLDTSFDQTVDNTVRAIKVQPDGKVLIGGSMSFVQSQLRVGLVRLNSNGTLDSSFGGRPTAAVYDVVLQPDNKILIGGAFIRVNNISALRIARLLNAAATPGSTPFDYDGDSKADVSVFRPSENKWYVLRSSDGAIYQPTFAAAGDIPVPADYDGDLKTDVAIFRPSNGQWWYQSSINGAQIANPFGENGDIPRPSDFDGDGKADLVRFRPSNNTWYRFGTTAGNVPNVVFGQAGDQPVIGDFDGDGKSDLAIFRPSNGDWWYSASSAGGEFRTVHWGQSGDLPVTADFDGDGKTDFAVFRPSEGGWYIYNSGGTFITTAFGLNGDRPIAADYDGDGRADIAVFRPSTGIWYLLRSTSGFTGLQFGISTDTPTPNAFVP